MKWTKEKERRAVEELAKIEGWCWEELYGCFMRKDSDGKFDSVWDNGSHNLPQLPNYLNSKDALTPIIEGMDDNTYDRFIKELCAVMDIECVEKRYGVFDYIDSVDPDICKATARQQAEAMLKAHGVWDKVKGAE